MKKILSTIVVFTMIMSLFVGLQVNAAAGNYTITAGGPSIMQSTDTANIDIPISISGVTDLTTWGAITIKMTYDSTKFTIVNGTAGSTGGNGKPKFTVGQAITDARTNLEATIGVATGIFVVDASTTKVAVTMTSDAFVNTNGNLGKFTFTPKYPVAAGDATFAIVVSSSDTNASDGLIPPASHVITGVNNIIDVQAPAPTLYDVTVTGGTATPTSAASGTSVSITADTAPTGQQFKNWTSSDVTFADSTSATTTFTMPANAVAVTANYEDIPATLYDVTVTNGTATPTSAASGTSVSITADTAPTGQRFKDWTSSDVTFTDSTSATTTFTMPAKAVAVTANYEDIPATLYDVTVTNGTATPTSAASGTSVSITADTAPTGQRFKNWTSSDVTFADSTSATTTFTMPANAVTVVANYEDIPATTYAVTVTNGTVDLTPVVSGATVTITADTAPEGQQFKNWTSDDGVTFADPTSATTTFTMPAKAVAVTANYEEIPVITGISAQLPTLTDVAPGTEVSVPVTFKNLPAGTKSFQFSFDYKTDKLTYKPESLVKGTGYGSVVVDSTENPGVLGVAGFTTETGVSGDQVVITFVFTVADPLPDEATYISLSNVKYGDTDNNLYSILSDKIVNGSIGIKTPTNPVVLAQNSAKSALNSALSNYNVADYSATNWTALNTAKTDGDAAIDAATTTDEVALAKQTALDDMADVKTIVEELADAKTNAKADLATKLATYSSTDYSPANWIVLNAFKTDGDDAIDAATTTDGVALAKQDAIDDMADVKTLAEEAAAALLEAKINAKADLNTALATYTEADYSTANWILLNTAKTDGDNAIEAATTTNEVALAKQAAIDDMADVKTIVEEDAAAVAAAIVKVNSGEFTHAELRATGTTVVVDDDVKISAYKLAIKVQKEIKKAVLVIADIDEAITAANVPVTSITNGDVKTGGDNDGLGANDAKEIQEYIVTIKVLTLDQAMRADYDQDGIITINDVNNILVKVAANLANANNG